MIKLKKNYQLKKEKKKLELAYQTRNTGYESELITYKTNHNIL
jgi:hypothetical protein